jgi:type VI secretion system protein ImpE
MTAAELYKAGDLSAARVAAQEAWHAAPNDLGARIFLAELLLFAGAFRQADELLAKVPTSIDPGAKRGIAALRSALVSEGKRQRLLTDADPMFWGGIPEHAQLRCVRCAKGAAHRRSTF